MKTRMFPKADKDEIGPNQTRVLRAMGFGLATGEIAQVLELDAKNVEYHRHRLCKLLNTDMNYLPRIAWAFGLAPLCLLLMLCSVAGAQPFLVVSNPVPVVQLAWSPPSPPPPSGTTISFYNVYWGTSSGQYTNAVNVGNVTNVTLNVPARGVMFVYAVTAVDSHGLQSTFSNEVGYTAPNPPNPPTQKPITVITVMKSPTPTGVFADAGMHWSDNPDQGQTYYKVKIDKGIMLSATTPPIPSK